MTRRHHRIAAAIGVAATAAIAAAALGSTPAHAEGDILGADAPGAIDGKYIVTLDEDLSKAGATDLLAEHDASIDDSFSSIEGFAVSMSEADAKQLAANPAIDYVAQDAKVSMSGTQTDATWGLDRIDQTETAGDGSYTYPDSAGSGVTAYIVDTGADLDHPDFGGRMSSGFDAVDNDDDASDCQGHGTHVAGTVGGDTYGVAKKANLVAVRVLDCNGSGTTAGVIAGIDWVAKNAQKPAVANMSLGGGVDQALNDAVTAAIDAGVTFAVAAGNDSGADACDGSPGSTEAALTVGATDSGDARADFSNIGSCVDVFAPGVDITSAWLDGGTNTISGTSMATPHVAGVAALHLGETPDATPAQVGEAITGNALKDKVTDPGTGSPNLLLNTEYLNGGGGDPGEPGECRAASAESVSIEDGATVESPVSVNCDGEATAVSVNVDITHTYRGDLLIELVDPAGNTHVLKENDAFDNAENVKETFSVTGSGAASGTWTLRVTDAYAGDSGTLNSWGLNA
ncbi:S8 family peptidase [Stackebrandtia nassauensis]|uniref:Peptidase S8 and S53 subtilisin kexin sedolisin n=1 Tax=Stackebrandtia nassauensis (strain DSM 44728 / CIP 108903 / NRRL B-16338 / NBRC 102104 / LLR-40K-21) TaxID=446470 RepID=D3PWA5_STANL|nr:S8 family peptidase [Stackebrandtia nassauensis]ADD41262.1 peptidase S8 and S53 subtilisin kexin sedolisin [Stackebrandtia nassauensis DSM 44728]